MKKHFILSCLAYGLFGYAIGVQQFGAKAGMHPNMVLGTFLLAYIFYVLVSFTSLEKVKSALKAKDDADALKDFPESNNNETI